MQNKEKRGEGEMKAPKAVPAWKEHATEEQLRELTEMAGRLADMMLALGVTDPGEAAREVVGQFVEKSLEGEMEAHLGYKKGGVPPVGQANRRNGRTTKTVRSSFGPIQISVPRDRKGTFEPKIVRKHQRSIEEFDRKVLAMYARGMSVRDIARTMSELYGTDVSPEVVSRATEHVAEHMEEWQNRLLAPFYYIVYIDALMAKSRENGGVEKRAVYTVVGVPPDGRREVLGLYIGTSESAKQWMAVLEDLRRRGVERIGILSADGLKGLAEAVEAVFPDTMFQTCVVHMIRNSVRLVPYQDRKEVCADLKKVYTAANASAAREALYEFKARWDAKYPMIGKSWEDRWDEWTTFLELPEEARRAVYTTNPIEALHRRLRKAIKTRGAFPSDKALMKVLYLAVRDAEAKWSRPAPYWARARVQLAIFLDVANEDIAGA